MMTKQRTIYIVLAASVLLNAFLCGMLVSHRMDFRGMRPGGPGGPPGFLMEAVRTLPPPEADKIRAIIDGNMKSSHEGMMGVHEALSSLRPILTAPSFDEKKFKETVRQADQHDIAIKKALSEMMVKIAKTLPDQDRIRFFGSLPPFGPPRF